MHSIVKRISCLALAAIQSPNRVVRNIAISSPVLVGRLAQDLPMSIRIVTAGSAERCQLHLLRGWSRCTATTKLRHASYCTQCKMQISNPPLSVSVTMQNGPTAFNACPSCIPSAAIKAVCLPFVLFTAHCGCYAGLTMVHALLLLWA